MKGLLSRHKWKTPIGFNKHTGPDGESLTYGETDWLSKKAGWAAPRFSSWAALLCTHVKREITPATVSRYAVFIQWWGEDNHGCPVTGTVQEKVGASASDSHPKVRPSMIEGVDGQSCIFTHRTEGMLANAQYARAVLESWVAIGRQETTAGECPLFF